MLYLTQRKQFFEQISLAPKLCDMYATIGVRDGGSGGQLPLPQFGQFVDINSGKESTVFGQNTIHVLLTPRSLLRYVSGRVTKETFIGYYSTTVKK